MQKKTITFLSIALLLMACGGNKPSATTESDTNSSSLLADTIAEDVQAQYDCTDAISMGLNGNVQHISGTVCTTYENNGKLEDGSVEAQYEIALNARGQLIVDEWGNKYGYDAEGNYYRGNHTYTTVNRDKQGRITEYVDIEPKKESESQFKLSLRYDKDGRVTSIEYGGGLISAWEEKRQYKGGNLYPAKMKHVETFEGGGGSKVTVTYRYTKFDKHNNWTERLCMTSTEEIDEVPVDSFIPNNPKVKDEIKVEKRDISYYE